MLVVVEWGDAYIDTDDFTKEEAEKVEPVYRTTVGFLVAKNQHGYVLASDKYRLDKDGYAASMFIPHGMIVSVNEVK